MRLHGALARILIFVLLLVAALHAQGDVYAINVDGGKWRYWKNGKEVQEFDYDGFGIYDRYRSAAGETYKLVMFPDTKRLAIQKDGSTLHYLTGDMVTVHCLAVSNGDVYVGGCGKNSNGKYFAIVLKNGNVLHRLTDGNTDAIAKAIAVSGGNVYAGGYEKDSAGKTIAMVWKNGSPLYRPADSGAISSTVSSLTVSGGDVYAGGYEVNSDEDAIMATVWKNGRVLRRINSTSGTFAYVESLFVQGGNVYAAGTERNAQGTWVANVWKNGETLYRLNDSSQAAKHLVFVAEPSVYTVIREGFSRSYWKNGLEVKEFSYDPSGDRFVSGGDKYDVFSRDNSGESGVTKNGRNLYVLKDGTNKDVFVQCVTVHNGDVYSGGCAEAGRAVAFEDEDTGEVFVAGGDKFRKTAMVWKNDRVLYRFTDGATQGTVSSIFVSDGDVYAGGCIKNAQGKWMATVWKNGNALYRLAEAPYEKGVESIFVHNGDVYAAGMGNDCVMVWKNGRELYRMKRGDYAKVVVFVR